jgi:hypothetical protein
MSMGFEGQPGETAKGAGRYYSNGCFGLGVVSPGMVSLLIFVVFLIIFFFGFLL